MYIIYIIKYNSKSINDEYSEKRFAGITNDLAKLL